MSIPVLELGRAIKRVQNKHHRDLDAALAEADLSLTQFDAMRAIVSNPGATSHDLARIVFMTDQSFGELANRLVRKGLITREAERGRALIHVLTDSGRAALEAGTAIANRVLDSSFVDLSEIERAQLLDFLSRLLALNSPAL